MGGGGRLILIFVLMLLVGAVYAADDSAGLCACGTAGRRRPRPVQEDFHGTKVVDKYRWLEDGNSADTQKWVAEEMAYSRALLDPLPGTRGDSQEAYRAVEHWQYLGCRRLAGNIISTRGARGCRISRCFMCAKVWMEKIACWVDANQLCRGWNDCSGLVRGLRSTENIWLTEPRRAGRR